VVWVLWLALPVAATALAALWAWWREWRARPRHVPTTDEAMRAHREYLDALIVPARGVARPEQRE
jgi:hypothetical protein